MPYPKPDSKLFIRDFYADIVIKCQEEDRVFLE